MLLVTRIGALLLLRLLSLVDVSDMRSRAADESNLVLLSFLSVRDFIRVKALARHVNVLKDLAATGYDHIFSGYNEPHVPLCSSSLGPYQLRNPA